MVAVEEGCLYRTSAVLKCESDICVREEAEEACELFLGRGVYRPQTAQQTWMQGDVVALLGQHLHAPYPMTYTERTTRPSLVRPSHGTHILLILAPVKDNDPPKILASAQYPTQSATPSGYCDTMM